LNVIIFGCIELEFVLIAIHADPSAVMEELESLLKVHQEVSTTLITENVCMLGDLNASCAYTNSEQMRSLGIRQSPFNWLIPDGADTTTSTATSCAYDRSIMLLDF